MKKFAIKSIAIAVGAVCSGAAFAGTVAALPAGVTKYAVESMLNTTDVTLPSVVYTMGVARTIAQDFTVIITPSAGATFTAGSCTAAIPVGASFTATVKRNGANECAYEVDVTTAFPAPVPGPAVSLTFAGLVLDTHTLATAGNTAGVTLNLWDLGETARIDNVGAVSLSAAVSGNALKLVAASDALTKTNVDNANGPLFGFVVGNGDTDFTADAAFVIQNNNSTDNWKRPDGVTLWDFTTVDGTAIAMTVPGNFQGMTTPNGFVVSSGLGVNPVVTATPAGTQATFTIAKTNIAAAPSNNSFSTVFTATGTTSLGTSRTFGISGVGDVAIGADVALAGNSAWWTWGANAIQLMSPYFSTDPGTNIFTRFFFQNLGSVPATYTATCQVETGKTATLGAAASGSLAVGQTTINARDVCSFSSGIRGAIVFTINAPAGNIKGTYNISINGLSTTFLPLQRPYNGGLEN